MTKQGCHRDEKPPQMNFSCLSQQSKTSNPLNWEQYRMPKGKTAILIILLHLNSILGTQITVFAKGKSSILRGSFLVLIRC